jgi:hypothetical protein
MSTHETTMLRSVILGAFCTVFAAFPVAAILGLLFRFPVPFRGIESGVDHVLPSMVAVIFYGLMGGFVLLAAAGALGGAIAYNAGNANKQTVNRFLAAFSIGIAAVALFFLAILDWIIGPW